MRHDDFPENTADENELIERNRVRRHIPWRYLSCSFTNVIRVIDRVAIGKVLYLINPQKSLLKILIFPSNLDLLKL